MLFYPVDGRLRDELGGVALGAYVGAIPCACLLLYLHIHTQEQNHVSAMGVCDCASVCLFLYAPPYHVQRVMVTYFDIVNTYLIE